MQGGYREADGLVKRKRPEKFRGFRADLWWLGRIYTRAGLGLSVGKQIIHRGVFGAGMFQTIYSAPQVWWPLMVLSLEWWTAVVLMLGLAPVLNPAAALARVGVLGSFGFSPLVDPLLLLPLLLLLTTLRL